MKRRSTQTLPTFHCERCSTGLSITITLNNINYYYHLLQDTMLCYAYCYAH